MSKVIWVLFAKINNQNMSLSFKTKKEATEHIKLIKILYPDAPHIKYVAPFKYVLNNDFNILKSKLDKECKAHEETKAKLEKANNKVGLINAFNF